MLPLPPSFPPIPPVPQSILIAARTGDAPGIPHLLPLLPRLPPARFKLEWTPAASPLTPDSAGMTPDDDGLMVETKGTP